MIITQIDRINKCMYINKLNVKHVSLLFITYKPSSKLK